jgi:hypothetical protein
MTDLYLYTLALPRASQTTVEQQFQQQLSKQGLLGEAAGNVEQISTEPGTKTISGVYRGEYAEKMAVELEELANRTDGALPLADPSEESSLRGYYAAETADVQVVNTKAQNLYRYQLQLAKEGTRESKRRRVTTNPYQPENDFGNQQTAYVGVPAAATDVAWYNGETEATEPVSVVETRTAEHGSVDVVDAQASSFSEPALVFDLPYQQEGKVDVVVWDDHGRAKLDSEGINAWQWVFASGHEFAGNPVVDNGLVRVHLDTNGLVVEEWDASTDSWTAVSLGASDWTLEGWDITEISPTRTDVQCRFENASSSKSPYYLDMSLKRGWEWPQWTVSEGETPPTPSGLVDLLDPVANESDYSPQAEQGLVARGEVRV